jgi:hypothetical protein
VPPIECSTQRPMANFVPCDRNQLTDAVAPALIN